VTQKEAIELLLTGVNRLQVNNGFFGASEGTIGNINVLQRELNAALKVWHQSGDTAELKQMAASLHLQGNLTDAEFKQIMEAIDGEK
jgi:hypothetical protein